MGEVESIFTVEDSSVELARKPGPSPWLILAGVIAVAALVFGWRCSAAKKKRERPAVPTTELPT